VLGMSPHMVVRGAALLSAGLAISACAGSPPEPAGTPLADSEACGHPAWTDLPDAPFAYVDANAKDGGDGSSDAPFSTVADALASTDDTLLQIRLLPGLHRGRVELTGDRSVLFEGACRDGVAWAPDDVESDQPAVSVNEHSGTPVGLHRLTLVGLDGWALQIDEGGATIHDLAVRTGTSGGIAVADGQLDGTDIWVHANPVAELAGVRGHTGLQGRRGATTNIDGLQVDSYRLNGILALDPDTTIHVRDGRLEGGQATTDDNTWAAAAASGATLSLADSSLVPTEGKGILVRDRDSLGVLDGVHIDGANGFGLQLGASATVDATDLVVSNALDAGILAIEPGTFSGVDVVVEGTTGLGYGLAVDGGADVYLDRADLRDNGSVGLIAEGIGTTVELHNSFVRDNLKSVATHRGYGTGIQDGAHLLAVDTVWSGNRGSQLVVGQGGGQAELVRVVLRDASADTEGEGWGLGVQDAGFVTATDLVVENIFHRGINVGGIGTRVELEDVVVRDIHDRGGAREGAVGFAVFDEATADVRNLVVERVGGTHVGVQTDAQLILKGATIRGGAATHDAWAPGLVGDEGAHIDAEDVEVIGVSGDGIGFGHEATGTLRDVTIRDTQRTNTYTVASGLSLCQGQVAALRLAISGTLGQDVYLRTCDGIATDHPPELSCTDCTFEGGQFAAMVLYDGIINLRGGSIGSAVPDRQHGGGVGIFSRDRPLPREVHLDGVEVAPQLLAGVWVEGAADVSITHSTLHASDGHLVDTPAGSYILHGNAFFAMDQPPGQGHFSLANNTIVGGAGIAVLLHNATAAYSDNTWPAAGDTVVQQGCGAHPAPDGVDTIPRAKVCPDIEQRVMGPLAYSSTVVVPDLDDDPSPPLPGTPHDPTNLCTRLRSSRPGGL